MRCVLCWLSGNVERHQIFARFDRRVVEDLLDAIQRSRRDILGEAPLAAEDGPVVARLREQGAVVLGGNARSRWAASFAPPCR